MNIGANWNAHGKRTVSTKQPQVTLDSWASRHLRGTCIELVFKSLDCFTVQCMTFKYFQGLPFRLFEFEDL